MLLENIKDRSVADVPDDDIEGLENKLAAMRERNDILFVKLHQLLTRATRSQYFVSEQNAIFDKPSDYFKAFIDPDNYISVTTRSGNGFLHTSYPHFHKLQRAQRRMAVVNKQVEHLRDRIRAIN